MKKEYEKPILSKNDYEVIVNIANLLSGSSSDSNILGDDDGNIWGGLH